MFRTPATQTFGASTMPNRLQADLRTTGLKDTRFRACWAHHAAVWLKMADYTSKDLVDTALGPMPAVWGEGDARMADPAIEAIEGITLLHIGFTRPLDDSRIMAMPTAGRIRLKS